MNKIARLQDPVEFTTLFQTYHRAIFGYILRRTGNVEDSADLAADTFHKAWVHLRRFVWRGVPIKVWLYRIATNEVNQYFRHRKKNRRLFGSLAPEAAAAFRQHLEEDKEALEAEMQHHAQFLKALEALKTLPLKYQEVLALRYFEGKPNKEIAAILSLREGTVKSILSRGLEKLREKCYGKEQLRRRVDPDDKTGDTRA